MDNARFSKLDSVIRRQRRLMLANAFVPFALIFGTVGMVWSVVGS